MKKKVQCPLQIHTSKSMKLQGRIKLLRRSQIVRKTIVPMIKLQFVPNDSLMYFTMTPVSLYNLYGIRLGQSLSHTPVYSLYSL